jgi:hypothetical protein
MVDKLMQTLAAIAIVCTLAAPLWAADATNPMHNFTNPVDVDNNGIVRPRDFLLVANRLQSQNSQAVHGLAEGPTYFWDTTNDNRVTPRDALLVANHLLATPEPSTIASGALGLLALTGCCWRLRRNRRSQRRAAA